MGIFDLFRKPLPVDLITVALRANGIDVAKVVRNRAAPPRVEICRSVERSASEQEALQFLRKDLHLDRYRCAMLLAADEYQLQLLDAPEVPDAELKSAIRWKLKDVLDYPVETATVDLVTVPADPNAPTRGKSVYAVAARNSVVESRMKQFAAAKVPLRVIDIPELAQRNIAALLETEARGLALLSFERDSCLLTFTSGGELYLSRRIEVGLDPLMQAAQERREQLFERITLELQRSLDHFDRQFSYVPLARLVIGPVPEEVEIDAYLARNLYVPVERIDLATVLDFGASEELRDPRAQQRYFHLLGAAQRGGAVSQQINLYNPAFEERHDHPSFNVLAATVVVAVLLIAAAGVLAGMRSESLAKRERALGDELRRATEQTNRMSEQAGKRQQDAQLLADLARAQSDLKAGEEVMTRLQGGALGNTAGYSEYLRAFARQSIEGLWLTGFNISGAGQDVVIEGRTLSAELVPDYLQRLNRERIMQGHAFSELRMQLPDVSTNGAQHGDRHAYLEFRLATVAAPDEVSRMPAGGSR